FGDVRPRIRTADIHFQVGRIWLERLEADFKLLDLLWIVLDQIHEEVMAGSASEGFDATPGSDHGRAFHCFTLEFILTGAGKAIEVCKPSAAGTQFDGPRTSSTSFCRSICPPRRA